MPYRLIDSQSLAGELKRIAREQIDRSIVEVDDGSLGFHDTVHQVRALRASA